MGAAPGVPAPGVLDLYDDPGWYDATYQRRRADVRYYVDRARRVGGPVLEYGVGSGRVAFATARAGLTVVGVDASAPMLACLEEKRRGLAPQLAARVRAIHGDMRSVHLGERFRLVTAPFNVVLHLESRRDMERWLARVREHLLPDGELVFDVSVPQPLDLAADPTVWERARSFRHPRSGRRTELAERFDYDPIRQVLLVESELRTEGARRALRVPLIHRQWFPRELEALLHYNGFVDIRFTADFTDLPPDDDVDSLVIACRAAPPPPRHGPLPPGRPRVRVARRPGRH